MEKILTISVAAYNVEKFLRQTLGSLTDPRYVDKLEVFVVDDGGRDGSLEIARDFERQYPQTFHAVHKENKSIDGSRSQQDMYYLHPQSSHLCGT